jgi:hypothetical protein
MYNNLYDKGDWCLRSSLYASALLMQGKPYAANNAIWHMEMECEPESIFFAKKSEEYRWSTSGSNNQEENTLFKRPTYWIWKHILRHFGINPYKGLNGDQFRAYFIYLFLTKQKLKALKILLGFIIRLGFFPSFIENILFKPQTAVMLLVTIWKPLWYMLYPFQKLSESSNLAEPISVSTTNKISLLMSMAALKRPLPSIEYIEEVYFTYFCNNINFIAEEIIKAFKIIKNNT